MKSLVVLIDGLLVETSDHILNESPLTHGLEFVHTLADEYLGSTMFVAQEGTEQAVRQWLARYGLRPTWVDVYENMNSLERVEAILSKVGERSATIDRFVTSKVYDATVMSTEGVVSIHFLHPTKVKNWGPDPGNAWQKAVRELDIEYGEEDADLV